MKTAYKFESLQDLKDYFKNNLENVKTVISKKTGLTNDNIKIDSHDKKVVITFNHRKNEFQTITARWCGEKYPRFKVTLDGFKYDKSSFLYNYNIEMVRRIYQSFNIFKVGYYYNSENTKKTLEKADTRKTQKAVISEQQQLIEQLKRENAELLKQENAEKKAKTN
jgi:hypothetical protein